MKWFKEFLARRAENKRRCDQLEIIVVDLLYQIMSDGKHPNTSIPLDSNQYLPTLRSKAQRLVNDDEKSMRRLGKRLRNFDLPGL